MVMLSERYISERARVDHLRGAIVEALSGRGVPALLDYNPTSRLCVGILTPALDEPDAGRAARRVRRKPDALGFMARVAPADGIVRGRITVCFALYHRAFPSFDEQRAVVGQPDPGTPYPLRQKFRRIEVVVPDLPFSARVSTGKSIEVIDFHAADRGIAAALHRAAADIAADPQSWPGVRDLTVLGAAHASEAAYESILPRGTPTLPGWRAELDGRLINTSDGWRFSLLVRNVSEEVKGSQHPEEFFDVRLEATLDEGAFVPEPFVAAALDYRYDTVAWGQGVNAVLEVEPESGTARTEALPVYDQPRTRSAGESDACSPAVLAGDGGLDALERVAAQLDAYASRWAAANAAFVGDESRPARERDLAHFRAEIARFRFGTESLQRDDRLLRAFRLANRAAQRRNLSAWRLFQLVFMVTIVPSLLAREQPDDAQLRRELDIVDVLWFPTGGGKTEAYFGVILIAMFYDRLRGKDLGTTAWLRYPLRMLSIQQLQRLVEFVVAAEEVRQETLPGVGGEFTVGYYVGAQNTPNELTLTKDIRPIDDLAREASNHDGDNTTLHVLQRCPFCREPNPAVEVDARLPVLRLRHRCRAASCRKIAPIYLSDAEIYRYAPTVLVGTVDRLARAGQTDHFSHIFGQFDATCPDHGYVSSGKCVEGACTVKPKAYVKLKPVHDPTPALILQDELHLLKESLGTYDAHFEGFLDAAAKRVGMGLPTKRLAATATIEGYAEHVREIYGREGRRFPAKGPEEFDSAYAVRDDTRPIGRVYLGILPFGIDSDEIAARIAEVVDEEAARQWAEPGADPGLVGQYDLSLIYVNQKNTGGNIGARLRDHLDVQTLTGDNTLDEVRGAIDRIEADRGKPYTERLKTLIATSLISHGVDLDRLNAMAFVGFPGRAADYIQSSSRVGRTNVGLVCTIFNPARNLDRSTYLHFHEYHERLYQLVQPVPVNRFSESSVGRTFTGIYSALLLNVVSPRLWRASKIDGSLRMGREVEKALGKGAITDDEMCDLVVESYGIERHGLPTEVVDKLRLLIGKRVKRARLDIEDSEELLMHRRLQPPPVASLRDVQEQVKFNIDPRRRRELDTLRGY